MQIFERLKDERLERIKDVLNDLLEGKEVKGIEIYEISEFLSQIDEELKNKKNAKKLEGILWELRYDIEEVIDSYINSIEGGL